MSGLEDAYSLNGPEDCARLYAQWASTYDGGFAASMDYRLPAHVAAAFLSHGGVGPVLDVGAGTGLLAAHLRSMGATFPIDGVDLSPQMLNLARAKALYRELWQADITQPLAVPGRYKGIVSSGTFTHGHVGPAAIDHLEALAEPGSLFALSINAGVYRTQGFDIALARRSSVTLMEVSIYGEAAALADPAHASDRGLIALWRHPA